VKHKWLTPLFISSLLLVTGLFSNAHAQTADDDQEVFLHFRHSGVVNVYVSAVYSNNRFYLSIEEVFSSLNLDVTTDPASFTISGTYLAQGPYSITLGPVRRARIQGREINFTADEFRITDFGYYLSPELLNEIFGLEFIPDFSNLALSLETDKTMPIVAQADRERRRDRLARTQQQLYRTYFPLRYDRNEQYLNGGFLDYNLTANFSENSSGYNFSSQIGAELLKGDLQGSIFGNFSQTATSVRTSGLRWRYGFIGNPWVSTAIVGQTTASGLAPVAFTGIKITNEPIEPRFLYDETIFTGDVAPDSEVELYRNNTLVDYQQADASGTYRFVVPLTYGTSQYTIRTYSPTGQQSQRDARVQVPFNFLPPGEFTYVFDAGRLDNPLAGITDRGFMTKANVNAGVTNWLTASGGVEYFEDFATDLPTFRGAVSARLLEGYLMSLEAANNAFYRANVSVIYPSSDSVSAEYTYFNTLGGLYNTGRTVSSFRTNIFTPFEIGDFPLFFRWSFSHDERESSNITRYRVDLNTRIGRTNIRLGYRDTQLGELQFLSTNTARISSSASYNFSRAASTPTILRGIFLRGQLNFIPSLSEFEDFEVQLSRNFMQRGSAQLAFGRNFLGDYNLLRFSFTFDFNNFRSTSSFRSTRNSNTFSQSVRGSVGYDSHNNKILPTNRQQVGRSGVAVRLFVDNNNSGTFDEGDVLIDQPALRVDRAGGTTFSKDGISYISQLQPYRQYNLTINKGAIANPLLVPSLDNFSIITDPNQFKAIDIPFYMSGLIDGMVFRRDLSGESGLGGVRLFMEQVNLEPGVMGHQEELRTFSDGSFFSYEIPPGDYIVYVDPNQLRFLNAVAEPDTLELTVQALAEGDFVEGLKIVIVPADLSIPDEVEVITVDVTDDTVFQRFGIDVDNLTPYRCQYGFQVGSFREFSNAMTAASQSQEATGLGFDLFFNSRNNLYAVRTTDLIRFEELEVALTNIEGSVNLNDFALISECNDDFDDSFRGAAVPQSFLIQVGSFARLENAENFSRKLRDSWALNTVIEYNPDREVYRVVTGPYENRNELRNAAEELSLISDITSSYIRLAPDQPTQQMNYDFQLMLGSFTSPDEAAQYIRNVNSEFGLSPFIVRNGVGRYDVLTDTSASDWKELQELQAHIADTAGYQPPLIHLIQNTDPDRPLADNVDGEKKTPIVLVTEDSTLPEGMKTEDFLAAAGIRTNNRLQECTFPVQVGSYRGLQTAREMASLLGDSLQVNIALHYNEPTDMFALRTVDNYTLAAALQSISDFQAILPFNEYGLVGKCGLTPAADTPGIVNFIVPIARYSDEIQAQAFADDAENRLALPSTVRFNEETELYDVFYGPFDNYDIALIAEEVINSEVDHDVLLLQDPLSNNRFNFSFQLHLISTPMTAQIVQAATNFSLFTARETEAFSDIDGRIHLLDGETFESWNRFINFVSSLREVRGINLSYLILE
jgi:hypothetical protein